MAEALKNKKKPAGRRTRTVQSLFVMIGIGASLAFFNAITLRNDIATATGPESPGQKQFFVDAADRPDIAVFFKGLTHEQRMGFAKNIGRYDDPKLPKLAAVLLADFDADARKELTQSLIRLAPTRADEIAKQMIQKGSFQQYGVGAALDAAGDRALPLVVNMLDVGDARPFAASYLTSKGQKSGPLLLPKLDSKDKDVRLAAADALGKLSYRPAVPALRALYDGVKDDAVKFDELIGYLSALSGTGEPNLEPLFTSLLADETKPIATRATSAFGLGRIGTPSATRTVWKYVDSDDSQLASNAVAALQRAGDIALKTAPKTGMGRLRVAAGIPGVESDKALELALLSTSISLSLTPGEMVTWDENKLEPISLAKDRPKLVPQLGQMLKKVNGEQSGEVADALIRTLTSTESGRVVLKTNKYSEPVTALINRRLAGS